MIPQKLVFVDVETTGLSVSHDRMIEIGIVRVENGKIVKTFQTLLNPGGVFPDAITSITGITPKDTENAPTFRQVKDEIQDILTDCVFVAHNVRFDYAFIKNAFKRENMTVTYKHFCTVRLSRILFPSEKSLSLESIINRFSLKTKRRHRAFDDASVLWDYYQLLQNKFSKEVFENALYSAMKRPFLPSLLSLDEVDTLPELPGVYIFYGKDGMPLYIGKSINVKERVLSHFADYASQTEMAIAQQVASIESHITSGELGALLKESLLIKKMQPMYNRVLRQKRKMTVVVKSQNDMGFYEAHIVEVDTIDPSLFEQIIGVFKSKQRAKAFLVEMAKKHSLCEKLLSLEKTKSACFAYRIGTCKGACTNQETHLTYNTRFILAFSAQKLKKWPFDGPIAILEKDPIEQTSEYFIVDKWCIIGSFSKQDEHHELKEQEFSYSFDVDTYKILLAYVSKKENWKHLFRIPFSDPLTGENKQEKQ